mmetsp:Transcript_9329/g.19222  ORF Transcript_9329/g.19222 Transcript_9329/m.19222 type:complete len:232 (+) Transcript_9329:288-983(+)
MSLTRRASSSSGRCPPKRRGSAWPRTPPRCTPRTLGGGARETSRPCTTPRARRSPRLSCARASSRGTAAGAVAPSTSSIPHTSRGRNSGPRRRRARSSRRRWTSDAWHTWTGIATAAAAVALRPCHAPATTPCASTPAMAASMSSSRRGASFRPGSTSEGVVATPGTTHTDSFNQRPRLPFGVVASDLLFFFGGLSCPKSAHHGLVQLHLRPATVAAGFAAPMFCGAPVQV